ncbi:uncharacterized protein LOC144712874 isoform X2 [Wolffia australiana]
MVTDQEIASCVESLLRQTDPGGAASSVNVNDVVQQLEAKLGLDLSHKAGFIRDQINLLFRSGNRDHHGFQPQHHLQQQFMGGHSHQLIPHHQIPASPFTHFPQQHELAFRCAPSVSVQQPHQLLQQQPPPHSQVDPDSESPVRVAVAVKQERSGKGRGSGTKGSKAAATIGVKRRGGPGGLSKVCSVSPELQTIVGEPTMSRTEIVKQLWAYIRKNNLQDPTNKRKIICNDELRLVFETDSTDMFKMNKLLAKHITTLAASKPEPEEKKSKTTDSPPSTELEAEASPVLISDELATFFGTGNREMFQSEALSRIWDYIKVYQLKDPVNPKMIRCDAKLQQLFGCESLSALGVSEMLGRHLFKQS